MPGPYKLALTAEQQAELKWACDHHAVPYVREHAAGILKVATGASIRQVALQGLLKRRRPEAVKDWIDLYLAEGLDGLLVKPGRFVLVYEDELPYYRRPTVAQGYALVASDEPYARQGLRPNLSYRIAASLDVRTGRLFTWQRKHFDRCTLIRCDQALETPYPDAELLFVAQDNGPVHFHEDILAALVDTKIILVSLPT